jgi:phospholipid transport system substrate-binding protein
MSRFCLPYVFFAFMMAFPLSSFSAETQQGANESPGAKAINSPAAGFVRQLGDKALSSLTAKELPEAERAQRVRALLRENFDIQAIGKFVLGTHWKEATDAQRDEYFKLFEDMIVRTYTQRFADYSGESFKVTGDAEPSGKEQDSMISSVIQQKNGAPPINIDWRVRSEGGGMKVADVLVDNVSMSVTQRADFDSVIQNGGGKVEALLASMRQKGITVSPTQ